MIDARQIEMRNTCDTANPSAWIKMKFDRNQTDCLLAIATEDEIKKYIMNESEKRNENTRKYGSKQLKMTSDENN